jgi:HK97 family phage major capsid protein
MGPRPAFHDPQPRTVAEAGERLEAFSAKLQAQYNTAQAGRRSAEKRAETAEHALVGELERRASSLSVSEPPVYGPGSRFSWFRDATAVAIPAAHIERDGGPAGAEKRLHDYAAFEHHRTERRLLGARQSAESLTEAAITSTRQEAMLYERWSRAGGQLFERQHELGGMDLERRALSRTQGSGGYFSPPDWMIDQFVRAPRAGAPFAALWTQLPMPRGFSSVNVPRFSVGGASGAVADGGSVPSRDPADGKVTANLITLAAQIDVAVQWLDQTPVPPDETLGADLAEDFMIQLDGQLLLGSGSAPQAAGVIPSGAFSAASMAWLQNTNNTAAQSWANGAGATPAIAGSLHQSAAQLHSKLSRYRGLQPTHWVTPPAVWDIISGSGADAQGRPLVLPGMCGPGEVPTLHRTPLIEDTNIPLTFGGATAPAMGTYSNGVTSPADGNGTWAPLLLGRWSDCIYWQTEPQVRVMPDVLSGTLQVRFQVMTYIAAMPNRVQWAGSNQTFSGTSQGGGVNTGAAVAYGGLTQFTTNGILQPAAAGF